VHSCATSRAHGLPLPHADARHSYEDACHSLKDAGHSLKDACVLQARLQARLQAKLRASRKL
jgi:hypothetical protein